MHRGADRHGDGDGHGHGHRGHGTATATPTVTPDARHGDTHGQRVAVVRRHAGPVGLRRPGPDPFPLPTRGGWRNRIGRPHHM